MQMKFKMKLKELKPGSTTAGDNRTYDWCCDHEFSKKYNFVRN